MRKHKGFTLVELVVVVMILGILAAVAAPKLLNTSAAATENGMKQTLSIVRDAIERYAAENAGQLPGEGGGDDLKTDLEDLLRGNFPTCPVAGKNADVAITSTAGTYPVVAGGASWAYNDADGHFYVNSADTTSDGLAYNEL